jgi:hypothetical protein
MKNNSYFNEVDGAIILVGCARAYYLIKTSSFVPGRSSRPAVRATLNTKTVA